MPGSDRTVIGFVAVVIAGTTIPAFGCERIVSTSRAAHPGGTTVSLLQNATKLAARRLEALVHPAREPEVLGVQDRVIGRASGKGRRFGLRSVVDDDQLVADVGVAANRVDEGSRELEVVPGEDDDGKGRRVGRR